MVQRVRKEIKYKTRKEKVQQTVVKSETRQVKRIKMVKKKVQVEKVQYEQKEVERTAVRMVNKKAEPMKKVLTFAQAPTDQCSCF